jgi:hypothetical protein
MSPAQSNCQHRYSVKTTRIRRSPRKHMTTMTGSNGSDTTSSGEGDDTVSGGRK